MLKSSKVALAFTILISGCSDGSSSDGANSASQTTALTSASTTAPANTATTTSSTVAETTTSAPRPLSSGDFEAPFEIVGPSAAKFVVVSNPAPDESDDQPDAANKYLNLYSSQIVDASVFVTTGWYETVADWLRFLTTHGQLTVTAEGTSQIGGLPATYVDIITDAGDGVLLYEGVSDVGLVDYADPNVVPAVPFAAAGMPVRVYLVEVDGQAVALFADDPSNIELETFLADVEAAFADWQWAS